jgi:hypothetical protein
MTAKYYTEFRLKDSHYRDGNEFSGVVELNKPLERHSDPGLIESILARNFDLSAETVRLVSWSRLH